MHKRWLTVYAIILFIGFSLRLWNLGTQSLWHDEGWSVFAGYTPFAPMGIRGADVNAPFAYYTSLAIWIRLVGDEVWSMRYLSVLYGVVTIALAAWIGRRWFGPRAGALAAFAIAISPILWVFSQEIRAYIPMPMYTLILLALLDQILRRPSRRLWLALCLFELLALYSQNLAVPLVAWLNVTAGLVYLIHRNWRGLVTWIAIQIGVLIAYLPWLLTQRQTGTLLNSPPKLNLDLIWSIWQSHFTGIKTLVNADSLLTALMAAFAVLAIIAIPMALWRYRNQRAWLLMSQVVFLPIFELAIILAARIDFHPRYFILGTPATMLLIAAGLENARRDRLSVPIKRLISHLRPALAAAMVILSSAIMIRMAEVVYSSPIHQHDDFRAIAQRYAELGPDDVIIVPYTWEPSIDYYSRKMNFKARFVEIPLHSSATTILDRLKSGLQGARRAEILTWFQLPADNRGAYPCLMNSFAAPPEATFTVNGLKTDRYVIDVDPAAVKEIAIDTPAVHYGPLSVERVYGLWGRNGLCALVDWSRRDPTPQNWRLSGRLTNPAGWDIAWRDTDILSDQQVPTSLWKPETRGTTFSFLQTEPGIQPEARYRFEATVYTLDGTQAAPFTMTASNPTPLIAPVPLGDFTRPIDSGLQQAPDQTDIPFAGGYFLHSSDLPGEAHIRQGDWLSLRLHWRVSGASAQRAYRLSLTGDGWTATAPEMLLYPGQSPQIVWHRLRIPADAKGKAILRITSEGAPEIRLGEYQIAQIGRLMSEPGMLINVRPESPLDFGGVGAIVGATVTESPVAAGSPFTVTLLWKAGATPETAYKVFVHLRAEDGSIIAQSDAVPAAGERPTVTWLAGEYVVDSHTLTWNRADYRGPATIAVGFYDPATNQRVVLNDGRDLAVLPVTVTVK